MQGSLETTGFRLPLRSADVPISSSTEAGRQLVGGMIREPRQYVGKPGVRIPLQTLMNQTRKAREPAAHIGMAGHVRCRVWQSSALKHVKHPRQRIRVNVRIHTDASPVAKIDFDQSNPGGCHGPHPPIILG